MTTLTLKPLTKTETKQLAALEADVKNGLAVVRDQQYKIGEALLEIRDKRLYRNDFRTFEDYCKNRWDMSKTHANRHISWTSTRQQLLESGIEMPPAKESQTRALNILPEKKRGEAWSKAIEANGGKMPTAKIVTEVVRSMESKAARPVQSPAPTTRYVNHTLMMRDLKRKAEQNGWDIPKAAMKFLEMYQS